MMRGSMPSNRHIPCPNPKCHRLFKTVQGAKKHGHHCWPKEDWKTFKAILDGMVKA